MNVAMIVGLLRERAQLRAHDGWAREQVLRYQERRLADLRAYAIEQSPFYRDVHRGLERAPLSALPIVTKATLMERFDDLVTDRNVHLSDVERHIDTASATDRFHDHYRVAATGGTTGRRGWQVIDEGHGVRVLLVGADRVDPSATAEAVRSALARVGAEDTPVVVDLVDAIPRTTLGKAPLIRRAHRAVAAH